MSGNGVDIAAVYQLLLQVAQTVSEHTLILNEHTQVLNGHTQVLNGHTRILTEHTRVLNEHTLLLHEHGRKLDDLEHGQVTLRQTLTQYHASVMGHGILFSELEHRVRRIEEHLNLPPVA
jgi:hypothetical protein